MVHQLAIFILYMHMGRAKFVHFFTFPGFYAPSVASAKYWRMKEMLEVERDFNREAWNSNIEEQETFNGRQYFVEHNKIARSRSSLTHSQQPNKTSMSNVARRIMVRDNKVSNKHSRNNLSMDVIVPVIRRGGSRVRLLEKCVVQSRNENVERGQRRSFVSPV
mmetsp:Transcript_39133/g.65637  ORF Transcript_39133/g.65637 Transcript_39133/m.65637 type:complete len:163 (+) Transcript_39133:285-773(+)